MFDQSYGLRFDIYERINLSEDLPGIEELEEVELIPHIQVIGQEEQATLRGHLLLAGVYKGDSETGESEPLEHWIPVEITVPLNRVASLDDIAVEIENFDVDLLSTRSLNITGVLSLKGIQAAAVQGPDDRAWDKEEIMVVHAPESHEPFVGYDDTGYPHSSTNIPAYPYLQVQEDNAQGHVAGFETNASAHERYEGSNNVYFKDGPASNYSSGYDNHTEIDNFNYAAGQELHREQDSQEHITAHPAEQPVPYSSTFPESQSMAESNPNVWNFERAEKADSNQNLPASYPGLADERQGEAISELQTAYDEMEASIEEKAEITTIQGAEISSGDSIIQEEQPSKPELKVAFSSKNSTVDSPSGVGFSSLLQSSRTVQEQEIAARESEEPFHEEAEQLEVEDVQWKSLFLGSRQEDTPFRKVRLCIVQREETIEAIAERYQLSPRELLLYNRLSEQNVEEGQVLYIP